MNMNEFKKEVGKRIVECRKNKNLKQKDLCDLIEGSTIQMISNWEKGHACPSPFYLCILAKTLDTSVDYLLTGEKKNSLSDKPKIHDVLETIVAMHLSGENKVKKVLDNSDITPYLTINIRDSNLIQFWEKMEKLNDARVVLGDPLYFEQVNKLIEQYSK